MNQEDIRRMGVDIDAVSLEMDRLSRRLARIAGQCGIKPPEATSLSERDLETIREALQHRLTTSGSDSHSIEINYLLRRV